MANSIKHLPKLDTRSPKETRKRNAQKRCEKSEKHVVKTDKAQVCRHI